jgi:diaminopimelate epimerase
LESGAVKSIPFVKMSGAGNDFVVLAERDLPDVEPGWLAQRLCARALSIGADGIIIMAPVDGESVRIRFHNPDGSIAEMCGNGSRCAARYAVDNRLVTETSFRLLTDSGDLPVRVLADGRYQVVMPTPDRIETHHLIYEDAGDEFDVHAIWVGVPHAVVEMDGLDEIDDERLIRIGRALRYHEAFPAGTNVNFIEERDDGSVRQRTYERGVEALTKACGTGATAVTAVLRELGRREPPLELAVDGGRLAIGVETDEAVERFWLTGDARLIATGIASPEALEW